MLWVLKRTVSMRRFFKAPKTYDKMMGKNAEELSKPVNYPKANIVFARKKRVKLTPRKSDMVDLKSSSQYHLISII